MRPHHEPRAPALAPGARVLVTGGAGFLGSHLVEELLQRSCKVQALDDLSSGAVANVEHLLGDPAFALHVGNAEDERLVERLVAGADVVFHLAGAVGVGWLAREPATVMQRNLRCTEVVLHACAGQHKPVLFTSSSEVYGDGPVPFVEHAQLRVGATTSVRGGYACAKAMGEWLAAGLAQQHGLHAVVARVFNTVGPRQVGHGGMVLPRFVEQALRGEPITVYGDGSQTRCFAHASETARALCDLMAHPAVSGAYNVGSDAEVTVAELARLVRVAAGSRSPIVHKPLHAVFPAGFSDPQRRVPCLARLRSAIGWAPSLPIDAIVRSLVGARAPAAALEAP